VSPTPGRVLFGPAAVISYYPSCSVALEPQRYNFANLFYEAVGDHSRFSYWPAHQHLMGGRTKHSGSGARAGGVLTDGQLRDFEELAGYDFAAYCSGEATRGRRRGRRSKPTCLSWLVGWA
jgi:hypothetical protein